MSRRKTTRLAGASALMAAGLLALPGAASAGISASVDGAGKLDVQSNAGDAITITSAAGKIEINGLAIAGNPDSASITAIEVQGGPSDNSINLAGVNAAAFGALTSVEVDGGGGNDTINGSQLADTLAGGDGDDRIVGDDNQPGTRDESLGQAGNDTLVWNPGDDDDTNEGGTGSDTAEVNGGGKEQFEVKPSATPGRVAFDRVQPDPTFGAPFTVDISDDTERLDLNAGGGDDIVNAAAGLDALALALDVDGGDGNDTLDGGDGPDLISGGAGDDRITGDDNPAGTRDDSRGDAGNDTLVWNPGDDDDLNEGGEGTDTVEVNGGAGGEVFEVKASAVPGRVLFDRTGPNPPGPFNVDIGSSERLDLNASGGDDSLNAAGPADGLAGWTIDADGGDGNDTLVGGSQAIDVLSGGAGADTLRTRDQSADTITCGTEADAVTADTQDTVNADCESVDRGQAAEPPAQDPPAEEPPAQDTAAPVVRIGKKTVKVGRSRIVAVRLTCPAGEPDGCVVRVKLVRNGRTIGTKRLSLDGGESKLAKVKLTRRVFRQLTKQGDLNVRLALTATDDAGNARQSSAKLKLKR